jgi:hypothetical protein
VEKLVYLLNLATASRNLTLAEKHKFSSYFLQSTMYLHYKDHQVSAVYGIITVYTDNNKYTLWTKYKVPEH